MNRDELETILTDVVAAAEPAYPTVMLPADVFVAYLYDQIPSDVPHAVALRQMHTADLYLACARRDMNGYSVFEERCLRPLDRALRKMGVGAAHSHRSLRRSSA